MYLSLNDVNKQANNGEFLAAVADLRIPRISNTQLRYMSPGMNRSLFITCYRITETNFLAVADEHFGWRGHLDWWRLSHYADRMIDHMISKCDQLPEHWKI